jgi:hypothetical protein
MSAQIRMIEIKNASDDACGSVFENSSFEDYFGFRISDFGFLNL